MTALPVNDCRPLNYSTLWGEYRRFVYVEVSDFHKVLQPISDKLQFHFTRVSLLHSFYG